MGQIKQDLAYILNKTEQGEIDVRDIIQGKPGLDQEDGLYRVYGGLIIDKIQYRGGTGRNIVKTEGFEVIRYERDEDNNPTEIDRLYVTKEEAIDLVSEFGGVNAYIKTNVNKKTKDRTNHLQPYPPRTESFVQDDRVIFVYEVDDQGVKVRPFNLLIEEDQCSFMLWQTLYADYQKRKERDAKQYKGSKAEDVRKIKQLKGDLRTRRLNVVNPYRKKQ